MEKGQQYTFHKTSVLVGPRELMRINLLEIRGGFAEH